MPSMPAQPAQPAPHRPPRAEPALVVIAAGVCAALHVGKLAPAVTTLQAELGLTLLQAGFLLSLVQAAGMGLGLLFGALADGLGARRSMGLGLATLAVASAAGGSVPGAGGVPWLMACRVAEGFGFLLVVLPAPGLVRALVPPARTAAMLGLWGAYMPLATALALLLGPLCIAALGWRAWWWVLALVSLGAWAALRRAVPAAGAGTRPGPHTAAPATPRLPLRLRLRLTLTTPGPWWVALCFAMYSGQWLAVIGFLPALYTQAGVAAAATGVLTALAAASNIVGNVAAGRLLQRGWHPGRLLAAGFGVMGAAALLAFADAATLDLPAWARYAAVLGFSGFGGLIPATLFALALRVAPGPQTVATTVGWVQQGSALGQFAGPPMVAWVASLAGGWQYTGLATGAWALAGLVFSALLVRGLPGGIQAAGGRGR